MFQALFSPHWKMRAGERRCRIFSNEMGSLIQVTRLRNYEVQIFDLLRRFFINLVFPSVLSLRSAGAEYTEQAWAKGQATTGTIGHLTQQVAELKVCNRFSVSQHAKLLLKCGPSFAL